VIDYKLYYASMIVGVCWAKKNEYHKSEQDPADKQIARISKTSINGIQ